MKKMLVLTMMVLLAMALVACGGASATPVPSGGTDTTTENTTEEEPGVEEPAAMAVTVEALDTLRFEPAELTAAVGQTVDITMNNAGVLEHNFVWEDDPDTDFIHTLGGESGENSRTFDAAGTYNFYCDVPGHREAGMVGSATVQ